MTPEGVAVQHGPDMVDHSQILSSDVPAACKTRRHSTVQDCLNPRLNPRKLQLHHPHTLSHTVVRAAHVHVICASQRVHQQHGRRAAAVAAATSSACGCGCVCGGGTGLVAFGGGAAVCAPWAWRRWIPPGA